MKTVTKLGSELYSLGYTLTEGGHRVRSDGRHSVRINNNGQYIWLLVEKLYFLSSVQLYIKSNVRPDIVQYPAEFVQYLAQLGKPQKFF